MDDEKLIECVKNRTAIYDTTHPKYMDSKYRAKMWNEIATELNGTSIACKTRWTNIRDQFKRNLNKRKTNSTFCPKRYKFEDVLEFLLPHLREQDPLNNEQDSSSDEEDDEVPTTATTTSTSTRLQHEPSASASQLLMKYILENKAKAENVHPIDAFLKGLSPTIKRFSPYYQHLAKAKIFEVVQKLELKQIPPDCKLHVGGNCGCTDMNRH